MRKKQKGSFCMKHRVEFDEAMAMLHDRVKWRRPIAASLIIIFLLEKREKQQEKRKSSKKYDIGNLRYVSVSGGSRIPSHFFATQRMRKSLQLLIFTCA